jgi:hypothetical protein
LTLKLLNSKTNETQKFGLSLESSQNDSTERSDSLYMKALKRTLYQQRYILAFVGFMFSALLGGYGVLIYLAVVYFGFNYMTELEKLKEEADE